MAVDDGQRNLHTLPTSTAPSNPDHRAQQQQQQGPSQPQKKTTKKRAWSIFGELYFSGNNERHSRSTFGPTVTSTSRAASGWTTRGAAGVGASRYPYKYHVLPSQESVTMGGETTGVSYHGDEHETESTSNLVPPHGGETNDIVLAQAPPPKGKYADVSFLDQVHLATVMFRMPFVVLWFALKSLALHPKSMKRHTTIAFIRWITGTCNYKEIQFLTPPSVDAYLQWTKRQKPRLEPFIEPLIDDAMVMWVGKKRTDRVVLYIPGGAYFFPLSGNAISFWRYVQLELQSQGIDVGLAILAYSLIPEAGFPTQLRQAQVALEHILASGVHPSNLHLVGDSAGGNLILSLLSHILHPLPIPHFRPFFTSLLQGLPQSQSPPPNHLFQSPPPSQGAPPTCPHTFIPIRGVYLMSPWVCMESTTASSRANLAYDIIVPSPSGPRANFVKAYLTSVAHIPYLDPLNAHAPRSSDAPTDSGSGSGSGSAWFAGLDDIVDRLLMSTGGKEVLRDDIIAFSQTMGKVKRREFGFVVQEGGVHVDPLLEFMFMNGKDGKSKDKGRGKVKGDGEVHSLTPMVVNWLVAGYRSS